MGYGPCADMGPPRQTSLTRLAISHTWIEAQIDLATHRCTGSLDLGTEALPNLR